MTKLKVITEDQKNVNTLKMGDQSVNSQRNNILLLQVPPHAGFNITLEDILTQRLVISLIVVPVTYSQILNGLGFTLSESPFEASSSTGILICFLVDTPGLRPPPLKLHINTAL